MMSGVNYIIYCCSSARSTPGVSLYQSLTLEENIVAVIIQDRVIDNNIIHKPVKPPHLEKLQIM